MGVANDSYIFSENVKKIKLNWWVIGNENANVDSRRQNRICAEKRVLLKRKCLSKKMGNFYVLQKNYVSVFFPLDSKQIFFRCSCYTISSIKKLYVSFDIDVKNWDVPVFMLQTFFCKKFFPNYFWKKVNKQQKYLFNFWQNKVLIRGHP